MSSSITPLKNKTPTFSSTTTTASSTTSSPLCSPITSASSNDSHTLKFIDKTLDKVKSFVPHHHHQQSKKTYPEPPTTVPQHHYYQRRSTESTESTRGPQRRQTVLPYGRHANEWLFGGLSVRRAVGGLFQHDN